MGWVKVGGLGADEKPVDALAKPGQGDENHQGPPNAGSAEKQDHHDRGYRHGGKDGEDDLPAQHVGEEADPGAASDAQEPGDSDGEGGLHLAVPGEEQEIEHVNNGNLGADGTDGAGGEKEENSGVPEGGPKGNAGAGLVRGLGLWGDRFGGSQGRRGGRERRVLVGSAALEQEVGEGDNHEEGDTEDAEGGLPADGGDEELGQGHDDGLSGGVAGIGGTQDDALGAGKPGCEGSRGGEGGDGGLADGGDDAVEDEDLPDVGGETAGDPADKDEAGGDGEHGTGSETVKEPAQQGGDEGPNQAGGGKDGGGEGETAAEVAPESHQENALDIFGAAFDGQVGEGKTENYPTVVEAAFNGGDQYSRF